MRVLFTAFLVIATACTGSSPLPDKGEQAATSSDTAKPDSGKLEPGSLAPKPQPDATDSENDDSSPVASLPTTSADDTLTEPVVADAPSAPTFEPGSEVRVGLFVTTNHCGGAAPSPEQLRGFPIAADAVAGSDAEGNVVPSTATPVETNDTAILPATHRFWFVRDKQTQRWLLGFPRDGTLRATRHKRQECAWEKACKQRSDMSKPCSTPPSSNRGGAVLEMEP